MPKKTKRIFGQSHSFWKSVLEALLLPILGLVLLNIVFMLDALFQLAVDAALGILFSGIDPNASFDWYPPLKHFAFVLFVILTFSHMARSKIPDFWKAVSFVVPLSAGLVTIGMFLYKMPFIATTLGLLFWLGTLLFIRKRNLPWLYYYSAVLVGLASVALAVFRIDI